MAWQQFDRGWRLAARDGEANSLVILLHGAGGESRDLLPLAEAWRDALPHTAFVSFDGGETFGGRRGGRVWYGLGGIDTASRRARVAAAYPGLHALIDREMAYWKALPARVALAGFSQGAIMALHHVVSDPVGVAGVVGYSGRLASAVSAYNPAKVTLIHGLGDTVIPFQETVSAAKTLHDSGFRAEHVLLPGVAHGISSEGVELGRDALTRLFA
ncbi:alpha/beta hydrolase [Paludibacterium paludis]|uniref:Phospholipase/carboxylesterase/thioesterase domain-containing protein n=1 Tax=Paludibacterium paludis TaxID=1225769 RepID=A0A918U7T5_9NEIS|nr:dienelactone hydrolase family protein [Paludibacterium paludis]GGY06995.1 hypothetical protein GCM10011289_06970 [Paludibacterium paludis]